METDKALKLALMLIPIAAMCIHLVFFMKQPHIKKDDQVS